MHDKDDKHQNPVYAAGLQPTYAILGRGHSHSLLPTPAHTYLESSRSHLAIRGLNRNQTKNYIT
jgi:hypothetical protein